MLIYDDIFYHVLRKEMARSRWVPKISNYAPVKEASLMLNPKSRLFHHIVTLYKTKTTAKSLP